jgi:hypothetical protein
MPASARSVTKMLVPILPRVMGPPGAAPALADLSLETGHQEIAELAYRYWQDRGCPNASPEEDWLRAERDLQAVAREAGQPALRTIF